MTIKKVPSSFKYIKNIERMYVCMGNAWTCDMQKKMHHGLSPIQTYQHTSILHTFKCMKIPLKCKWNAMYEVLNTFKWKPNPKFQWKLINFEKPQNFSKTPKSMFQNMKCMNEKGLEAYKVYKNWKSLKNPCGRGLEWKGECLEDE